MQHLDPYQALLIENTQKRVFVEDYAPDTGLSIKNQTSGISFDDALGYAAEAIDAGLGFVGYLASRHPHHMGRSSNYSNILMMSKIISEDRLRVAEEEAINQHIAKSFIFLPPQNSNHSDHIKRAAWITKFQLQNIQANLVSFTEEDSHKIKFNLNDWASKNKEMLILFNEPTFEFVTRATAQPTLSQIQINLAMPGIPTDVKNELKNLEDTYTKNVNALYAMDNTVLAAILAKFPAPDAKRQLYTDHYLLEACKLAIIQCAASNDTSSPLYINAQSILQANHQICELGRAMQLPNIANAIKSDQLNTQSASFQQAINNIKQTFLSPEAKSSFQSFAAKKYAAFDSVLSIYKMDKVQNLIDDLNQLDYNAAFERSSIEIGNEYLIDHDLLEEALDSQLARLHARKENDNIATPLKRSNASFTSASSSQPASPRSPASSPRLFRSAPPVKRAASDFSMDHPSSAASAAAPPLARSESLPTAEKQRFTSNPSPRQRTHDKRSTAEEVAQQLQDVKAKTQATTSSPEQPTFSSGIKPKR